MILLWGKRVFGKDDMDISVSQLNNRLALQLPPELPLGLVFVTGKVKDLLIEMGSEPKRP